MNGAKTFFDNWYLNNRFLRNSGPLEVRLFQCYEVLWIHNIDVTHKYFLKSNNRWRCTSVNKCQGKQTCGTIQRQSLYKLQTALCAELDQQLGSNFHVCQINFDLPIHDLFYLIGDCFIMINTLYFLSVHLALINNNELKLG